MKLFIVALFAVGFSQPPKAILDACKTELDACNAKAATCGAAAKAALACSGEKADECVKASGITGDKGGVEGKAAFKCIDDKIKAAEAAAKAKAGGDGDKKAAGGDGDKKAAGGDGDKKAAGGDGDKKAAGGDGDKKAAAGDGEKKADDKKSTKVTATFATTLKGVKSPKDWKSGTALPAAFAAKIKAAIIAGATAAGVDATVAAAIKIVKVETAARRRLAAAKALTVTWSAEFADKAKADAGKKAVADKAAAFDKAVGTALKASLTAEEKDGEPSSATKAVAAKAAAGAKSAAASFSLAAAAVSMVAVFFN